MPVGFSFATAILSLRFFFVHSYWLVLDALIGSKQEACHSVAIEAILIFTLSQLGELGRFAKWFMMLRPRISSTTFSATKLLVRWRNVV